jgi:hypothetical protein
MFPISCRDLEFMPLDPGLFGRTGEADSAPPGTIAPGLDENYVKVRPDDRLPGVRPSAGACNSFEEG